MSLKIAHVTGSRRGLTQTIDRDSILLGRGRHNDIAFDPFEDSVVSAKHAEIRVESGHPVLYDMGSLNGTFLNGHAVDRAELRKGDEIGLGAYGPRLVFDLDPSQSTRRPSIIPMKTLADDHRPDVGEARLKTQSEMRALEIDEQIATRNWRIWALLLGFMLALVAFGFIAAS